MATKKTSKKPAPKKSSSTKKTTKKPAKKTVKKTPAKKTVNKAPAKKPVKKAPAKKTVKKAAKKKAAKKKEVKEPKRIINPQEHFLVPKHEVLDEKNVQTFFKKYHVQPTNLPTIKITDAALHNLEPKIGDIIQITRNSATAGKAHYYRRVAYE